LGAGLYCRAKHLAFMKYFNVVMPTVALAQAFGRIGCFFAGCCYGVETHSHFALTFPGGSLAPAGVPLVPTQLLSSFGDFVLFVILYQALKNSKTENRVAALYLILYSIGRFLIEFVRGDIIRGKIGILSTSQFIAIWVLLAGIIMYIYLGKKEKKA
ncbi:MAG: prolipoprotein diacylglyceryl transferase, partial [Lactimicrobium massiliense]